MSQNTCIEYNANSKTVKLLAYYSNIALILRFFVMFDFLKKARLLFKIGCLYCSVLS